MKFKTWIKRLASSVVVLAAMSMIGACASLKPSVYHKFSFDGWADKWASEVDLLEYRYEGEGNTIQKRAGTEESLAPRYAITAQMPVATDLYVRWRVRSTRQVFERHIDLRGQFPSDMYLNAVTFSIDHDQIYVYLVTPKDRAARPLPLLKTHWSQIRETYEIYPVNQLGNLFKEK